MASATETPSALPPSESLGETLVVQEAPPPGPWLPPRALLDVGVWIALLDDAHQFSDLANAFIETPGQRIATCPIVENGVMRIMSMPSYGRGGGLPIGQVHAQLQRACLTLDHQFWADDVSLRDDTLIDISRVQGHQQLTDLYLLALAVQHGGCLVTFDRAIALSSVRGATSANLRVL